MYIMYSEKPYNIGKSDMKNIKNKQKSVEWFRDQITENTNNENEKFSYLEEYKKSMKNPLIQAYKLHLDMLHEVYIEELNKNIKLKKEIEDLINFIYDYVMITNWNKFEEIKSKYKEDFDNLYQFTK